jgi:lauroyl/myristoyl acyltransferase
MAERMADLHFFLAGGEGKSYKRAIFDSLSMVLGETTKSRQVQKMARRSYHNFARYLSEFLSLPRLKKQDLLRLVVPVGLENLDYALSRKKGVILLSIHFGNWEWGAMAISLCGYPVNFLVRKHQNRWTNELFYRIRREKGVGVLFLDQLKEAIQCLRRNEIWAILADENVKEGVEVNFFGEIITIPAGPFKLARHTEALIAPAFAVRSRCQKANQRAIIELPFRVEERLAQEHSIQEAAGRFMSVVRNYVQYYPDHWILGEPKTVKRRSQP